MHFLPLITSVVTIVLAVCGWKVVYRNAKKLARRNENFQLINRINQLIEGTTHECISYWTKAPESDQVRRLESISFEKKVANIKLEIDNLERRNFSIAGVSSALFKYRNAITLDVSYVVKKDIDYKTKKIEDISDTSVALKSLLSQAFINRFIDIKRD